MKKEKNLTYTYHTPDNLPDRIKSTPAWIWFQELNISILQCIFIDNWQQIVSLNYAM